MVGAIYMSWHASWVVLGKVGSSAARDVSFNGSFPALSCACLTGQPAVVGCLCVLAQQQVAGHQHTRHSRLARVLRAQHRQCNWVKDAC